MEEMARTFNATVCASPGRQDVNTLVIGGVRYVFHSCFEGPFFQIPYWGRKSFLSNEITYRYLDCVDIFVEVGMVPAPPVGFSEIFSFEGLWKCFKCKKLYFFLFTDGFHDERPVLAITLDVSEKKGTLVCDAKRWKNGDALRRVSPFSFPVDQVITGLYLAENQGGIFHSSGYVYKGKSLVFPARSGTGKSTLASMIRTVTGETLLSDERIIIRTDGDQIKAYGSPWSSSAGEAANDSAPLAAIFFLEQGQENTIESVSLSESFSLLMPILLVYWFDPQKIHEMMSFVELLLEKIPCYRFSFTKDSHAVDYLFSFCDEHLIR